MAMDYNFLPVKFCQAKIINATSRQCALPNLTVLLRPKESVVVNGNNVFNGEYDAFHIF